MTQPAKGRELGCGWYAAGPALATVATLAGTAVISRRWDPCPFGMDAPTRAGAVMFMPLAWIGMTVLLAVFQGALVAVLPDDTDPKVKWVALFMAAVVLFVLYLALGHTPSTARPDGSCPGG